MQCHSSQERWLRGKVKTLGLGSYIVFPIAQLTLMSSQPTHPGRCWPGLSNARLGVGATEYGNLFVTQASCVDDSAHLGSNRERSSPGSRGPPPSRQEDSGRSESRQACLAQSVLLPHINLLPDLKIPSQPCGTLPGLSGNLMPPSWLGPHLFLALFLLWP